MLQALGQYGKNPVKPNFKEWRTGKAWIQHCDSVKTDINFNIHSARIYGITTVLCHYDVTCLTQLYYDESEKDCYKNASDYTLQY